MKEAIIVILDSDVTDIFAAFSQVKAAGMEVTGVFQSEPGSVGLEVIVGNCDKKQIDTISSLKGVYSVEKETEHLKELYNVKNEFLNKIKEINDTV